MVTRPPDPAAMEGFQSLPGEEATVNGDENESPFCVALKICARPLRHPCQAIQTLPALSVAAAGNTSDPADLEICTGAPGALPSMGRAQISKSGTGPG